MLVEFEAAPVPLASHVNVLVGEGYFVCTHADILPGPPFHPHVRGWAKRSILEPPGPEPPLLPPPFRTRVLVSDLLESPTPKPTPIHPPYSSSHQPPSGHLLSPSQL